MNRFRPRDSAVDTVAGPEGGARGALRVGSLLIAVGILVTVALAAAVAGPQLVTYVDELDGQDHEVDPPEPDEWQPPETDPADPGESTYETDEETVSSTEVEEHVHRLVNEERVEHGLDPIDFDGTVASVSRAHSLDMNERDYFAHINPDEESPHERFQQVADYCQAYGENIARTAVGEPVERAHDGERVEYHTAEELAQGLVEQWMNSEEHRATILEEDTGEWERGGVGVYLTDDGTVFATHNFCTVW